LALTGQIQIGTPDQMDIGANSHDFACAQHLRFDQRVLATLQGAGGFLGVPIHAVKDERMASSTDMSSTCTQSRGTNTV